MGNITAGPLVRSALEAISYRNYGDPVCEVPPMPMWKHNVSLTTIGSPIHAQATKNDLDRWGSMIQDSLRTAIAALGLPGRQNS